MKHDIKFRGYAKEKGIGWVYGFLVKSDNKTFILFDIVEGPIKFKDKTELDFVNKCVEVIPESVGMYIGLGDINTIDIYEGDIVKCPIYSDGYPKPIDVKCGTVVYDIDSPKPGFEIEELTFYDYHWCQVEVIGNIYKNAELLEK